MYSFSDPLLQELCTEVALPKIVFTQKLKAFYKEKKCTSVQDYLIEVRDAKTLFSVLHKRVSDATLSLDEQYNTARLIRLSLSWKLSDHIFSDIFPDMLAYIQKNVLHANGNVRNETLFLLGDFLFCIHMLIGPRYPRKKRNKTEQAYADRFYPSLIQFHRDFCTMEHEYIEMHRADLWEEDIGYDGEFVPYSGDTHDKTLARIRRVLECMDVGYVMNTFATYGYAPYENPDTLDFDADFSEKLYTSLIDPIAFQKDLQLFLMLSGLMTTVDDIKKRIFHAETLSMSGNRQYNEWFLSLLDAKNIEISQEILDIFTTAWNIFPHQSLGGMSPQEKARELYGERETSELGL